MAFQKKSNTNKDIYFKEQITIVGSSGITPADLATRF